MSVVAAIQGLQNDLENKRGADGDVGIADADGEQPGSEECHRAETRYRHSVECDASWVRRAEIDGEGLE